MVHKSNASLGYAEATKGSIEKVLDTMKCYGLEENSATFLDIGSGFGKVVFHASLRTKV